MALVEHGRVPVKLHRLVATAKLVLPDYVVSARLEFQQRAPRSVGLGNKHLVAHDHRTARVDTFELRRPPGEVEVNLASRRVEHHQPAASKDEAALAFVAPGSAGGWRFGRAP